MIPILEIVELYNIVNLIILVYNIKEFVEETNKDISINKLIQ